MGRSIIECSVEGCETEAAALGFCHKHYKRYLRHGDPLVTLRPNYSRGPKFCVVEGCKRRQRRNCMCNKHAYRAEHFGDVNREPDAIHHPLYERWKGMHARCRNPDNNRFDRYGGRGIKVCERWDDFRTFIADMGMPPAPDMSIDRINNDGDYTPENCRWATQKQQMNNAHLRWDHRKRHVDGTFA